MKPFQPPPARRDTRFLTALVGIVAAVCWIALYALIEAGIGGDRVLVAIAALAAPAAILVLMRLEWVALIAPRARHRKPPAPDITALWPLDDRTTPLQAAHHRLRAGNDR